MLQIIDIVCLDPKNIVNQTVVCQIIIYENTYQCLIYSCDDNLQTAIASRTITTEEVKPLTTGTLQSEVSHNRWVPFVRTDFYENLFCLHKEMISVLSCSWSVIAKLGLTLQLSVANICRHWSPHWLVRDRSLNLLCPFPSRSNLSPKRQDWNPLLLSRRSRMFQQMRKSETVTFWGSWHTAMKVMMSKKHILVLKDSVYTNVCFRCTFIWHYKDFTNFPFIGHIQFRLWYHIVLPHVLGLPEKVVAVDGMGQSVFIIWEELFLHYAIGVIVRQWVVE